MLGVVGLDVGSQYSYVAAARKGGIDVLVNEASQRYTPTMVGFGSEKRTRGDAAAVQRLRNVANTVACIKQVLGRPWADAELQQELAQSGLRAAHLPGAPAGEDVRLSVSLRGEKLELSPTQVASMFLDHLKNIAANELQCPVRDVVIGVPGFWNDAQRRALLAAADLAGLNCLRLLNENTAAALGWGIQRSAQLVGDETQNVIFYDMGYASTQASLVQFSAGRLRVLASAYDPSFGGRSIDRALFDWAVEEIQKKYRIDVRTNARASLRLMTACEKLKITLNGIPSTTLAVESLMNDVDVNIPVLRETMEKVLEPLAPRFVAPLDAVLARSGFALDAIASVEAVGGSSRLRVGMAALQARLGREVSRTINSEEAVAKGCAMMCAILSPAFRVRDYKVEECVSQPIHLRWRDPVDVAAEPSAPLLAFPAGTRVPAYKLVTFPKPKPLELFAEYAEDAVLPVGVPREVGRISISAIPALEHSDPAKMLVRVHLDDNMVLGVESIKLEQRVATDAAGAIEEEPAPGSDAAAAAAAADAKSAAKVVRVDVSYSLAVANGASALLDGWRAVERGWAESDREVEEKVRAHNDLESYILATRRGLDGRLGPCAPDAVAAELRKLADEFESWLYDNGDDASRLDFLTRLEKMKQLRDPVDKRAYEAEERPPALAEFQRAMARAREMAATTDAAYEHIGAEDRDKILAKVQSAEDYILPKVEAQKALGPTADPVVLSADLYQYARNVLDFATPVMNKPKPKPKPKEEPAPAPAAADAPTDEASGKPADATSEANVSMDIEKNE